MPEIPLVAREIRLAAIPDGLPDPADLAVTEAPVPVPGPGEVLARPGRRPGSSSSGRCPASF